jgi:pyrroline-5-carboxylate reductase
MKVLSLKNITSRKPLVLVGLGNMGKAMLKGWCNNGLSPDAVWVISPNAIESAEIFPVLPKSIFLNSTEQLAPDVTPSAVILAVKPQIMDMVMPPCTRFLNCNPLYLSIAAGKSLNYFSRFLGLNAQIVRAMPNTPASIGLGMTAAVANIHVTQEQKELCASLLSAVGAFEWLGDEGLMDAVTAVSGSGPAYLFLLAESLTEAAIKQGIPPEIARKLAYQTIIGSAALLGVEMVKDIATAKPTAVRLREQVTSPNGTTAAALTVLMAPNTGMPELMNNAVQRATVRSRELNGPTIPQDKIPERETE